MPPPFVNAAITQAGTTKMTEHAQSERSEAKSQPWKGKMSGHELEIGLASAFLVVPMLTLAALLIGLIYKNQMPDHNSSYSLDNQTALTLGSAYFVNFSSTTLVYIASLSSTLATLLIPAAMLLYSFVLADDLARDSDRTAVSNLPSPFQLDMLIKMIEGRLLALWSYTRYAFGSKRRRTNIAPCLHHASITLLALAVLALLVTLADLWLHLVTKSVLYLELRPEQPSSAFAPGRELIPSCLNDQSDSLDQGEPVSCLSGPNSQLHNLTEFFRTAANYSDINRIYVIDGNAVLGPVKPPIDLDFQARNFGSQTSCRAVTGLCGSKTTFVGSTNYNDFNFVCNATMAGLNMTGNFWNILAPVNKTGESSGPAVTGANQGVDTVLGGNTIVGNDFSIGFQYFTGSQMLTQSPIPSKTVGTYEDTHQLHWGLVWWAPFTTPLTHGYSLSFSGVNDTLAWDTPVTNETAAVGAVTDLLRGSLGILSCETNISEVTYSFIDGTMSITSSRVPRTNVAIPFVAGITSQWGYDHFHTGVQQSFAAANSSEDFAARFATYYDQILLSIPAGVTLPMPFLNASRRVQTPVTRVPKTPFFAVLLLDFIYAAAGLVLTISAFAASAQGRGARDVQARLSVAAVVAEAFEDASLGDDAVDLDELYAERKGLVTKRVAFSRRDGWGRCFRQIDEKKNEEEEREEEDERRLL